MQEKNIKENGEVELMAITPQTIYFSYVAGYNNAPTILGQIAEIYGHGYGAAGTRSMTVEDVDKYTSFNKTTYRNGYKWYYGVTTSFSFSSNLTYPITIEGAESGATSDVIISSSETYTVPQTYYKYGITGYKKSGVSDSAYNMLTGGDYWLASRFCDLCSTYSWLGVRRVGSGSVEGGYMFGSNGSTVASWSSVAPVVSLKSNIQTSGQDENGVWQLK